MNQTKDVVIPLLKQFKLAFSIAGTEPSSQIAIITVSLVMNNDIADV